MRRCGGYWLGLLAALLIAGPQGALAADAPVNLGPPGVSGVGEPGQTLTCSAGAWSNDPTSFSYSWYGGAAGVLNTDTTQQYTVTDADVGLPLACIVIATSAGGSTPAVSGPLFLGKPLRLAPAPVGLPAISGNADPGQTLTCSTGAWINDPTSFTFSWRGGGAAADTTSRYTLGAGDLGQTITCSVVASNPALGASAPEVSRPVLIGAPHGDAGGAAPTRVPTAPPPSLLSLSVSTQAGGFTLHYSLDGSAGVLLSIQRLARGRYVTVDRIGIHRASGGSHVFHRRGQPPPGRYRVLAAAVNAGGWSRVRTTAFTIVATHR